MKTPTPNPYFGESGFGETGFGESGFGESGRHGAVSWDHYYLCWLQTSMFCFLVFVWPWTSVPRRRHTSGLRKSSTAATLFHRQIVCCSTHTQHIPRQKLFLLPGHVFGTVFWPTCTTRTLPTAVSGVNSKHLCFNVVSGTQCDFF